MAAQALAELMGRVEAGDRDAQAQLLAEAGPPLYGLAREMLGSGPEAGEALEEALAAIRADAAMVPATRQEGRAWMVRHLHRAARARQTPPEKIPELPEPAAYLAANPAAESLDEDALSAIRQAWVYGAAYPALARVHGMHIAGVRNWLRDNLILLRDDEADGPAELADHPLLAGEQALGLLSPEEAQAYREAAAVMPELAAEEEAWAMHFALFAEDIPAVAPEPELRARLIGGLFPEDRQPLWRRLGIVPAISGGAIAALVLVGAVRLGLVPGDEAEIAAESAAPAVVAAAPELSAEVTDGRLTVGLAGPAGEAGSERYWLWLLPPAGEAQPLGAIGPGGEIVLQLPGDLWPAGAELGLSAGPSPDSPILSRRAPALD
ncbi:hypothetical protein ACXN5S_09315 [Pseudoroseicyclus sp. H15]